MKKLVLLITIFMFIVISIIAETFPLEEVLNPDSIFVSGEKIYISEGATIYIYGKHFQKKGNLIFLKTIKISPVWSKIIYYPKVANAQHRLEMVIPKNAPTCKYEFQVTTIFGSSNKVTPLSNGSQDPG